MSRNEARIGRFGVGKGKTRSIPSKQSGRKEVQGPLPLASFPKPRGLGLGRKGLGEKRADGGIQVDEIHSRLLKSPRKAGVRWFIGPKAMGRSSATTRARILCHWLHLSITLMLDDMETISILRLRTGRPESTRSASCQALEASQARMAPL